MTTSHTGIVRGRRIELDDPPPLPEGQRVAVTVEPITPMTEKGAPAAVLAALDQSPHLTKEDVAELERAVEQGKLPVRSAGPFDSTCG